MKYFVIWERQYEGNGVEEFDSEEGAVGYINRFLSADNRSSFRLIEGSELLLEPVTVVNAYRVKR